MEKTGGEGMLDVGKSVLRLSVNYVDIRFIASTAGLTNFFFLLEIMEWMNTYQTMPAGPPAPR